MVQDRAIQWQTDRKYIICRILPFSTTLNDPNPDFKNTLLGELTTLPQKPPDPQ